MYAISQFWDCGVLRMRSDGSRSPWLKAVRCKWKHRRRRRRRRRSTSSYCYISTYLSYIRNVKRQTSAKIVVLYVRGIVVPATRLPVHRSLWKGFDVTFISHMANIARKLRRQAFNFIQVASARRGGAAPLFFSLGLPQFDSSSYNATRPDPTPRTAPRRINIHCSSVSAPRAALPVPDSFFFSNQVQNSESWRVAAHLCESRELENKTKTINPTNIFVLEHPTRRPVASRRVKQFCFIAATSRHFSKG